MKKGTQSPKKNTANANAGSPKFQQLIALIQLMDLGINVENAVTGAQRQVERLMYTAFQTISADDLLLAFHETTPTIQARVRQALQSQNNPLVLVQQILTLNTFINTMKRQVEDETPNKTVANNNNNNQRNDRDDIDFEYDPADFVAKEDDFEYNPADFESDSDSDDDDDDDDNDNDNDNNNDYGYEEIVTARQTQLTADQTAPGLQEIITLGEMLGLMIHIDENAFKKDAPIAYGKLKDSLATQTEAFFNNFSDLNETQRTQFRTNMQNKYNNSPLNFINAMLEVLKSDDFLIDNLNQHFPTQNPPANPTSPATPVRKRTADTIPPSVESEHAAAKKPRNTATTTTTTTTTAPAATPVIPVVAPNNNNNNNRVEPGVPRVALIHRYNRLLALGHQAEIAAELRINLDRLYPVADTDTTDQQMDRYHQRIRALDAYDQDKKTNAELTVAGFFTRYGKDMAKVKPTTTAAAPSEATTNRRPTRSALLQAALERAAGNNNNNNNNANPDTAPKKDEKKKTLHFR